MFTGLVQGVGTVALRRESDSGLRLGIDCAKVASGVRTGDSISVSGVCLTVVAINNEHCEFDVIPQTLALTRLGDLEIAGRVNLERALRLGDPLGGHLVQGHVDGTGLVMESSREGLQRRLRISAAAEILKSVHAQGSITVDGVSLTVAARDQEWFEVALIPETLARTTLGALIAGDCVNIEVDAMARMIGAAVAREFARRGL